MGKSNAVVTVELAEDEGRGSITPGWEIHINVGGANFSYEGRMQRDDQSKTKAIHLGQRVATEIGAEFKLIE